jgi:hypothetical protein
MIINKLTNFFLLRISYFEYIFGKKKNDLLHQAKSIE